MLCLPVGSSGVLCLCAALAVAPLRADAQVDYARAKGVYRAGAQDYCFDGPYEAGARDRWLALVGTGSTWELQTATVRRGRVKAVSGTPRFFVKPPGLRPRPVVAANIVRPDTGNGQSSDAKFVFGGKTWHWVEWGDLAFHLRQGEKRWGVEDASVDEERLVMAPHAPDVPAEVRASTERHRDDYETGSMALLWAGDLNGDGLPDLITYRRIKEVWGAMLWTSFRDAAGEFRLRLVAREVDGCS